MKAASVARSRWQSPGRDAMAGRMSPAISLPLLSMDQARRLLLESDAEMQAGHHAAAERLAHRAAELRGWGA